jgi:hypothetical protein
MSRTLGRAEDIYENPVCKHYLVCALASKVLSHVWVTVEGVWNGDSIYWPLQIVTTSNYGAIAYLHTLQITTAYARSSQSALTSRFLVTDFNIGDSKVSVLMSLPAGQYNWQLAPIVLITSRHGQHTKHCFQQFLYCSVWIHAVGTCLSAKALLGNCYVYCLLRICCLAAGVVSRSLPSTRSLHIFHMQLSTHLLVSHILSKCCQRKT